MAREKTRVLNQVSVPQTQRQNTQKNTKNKRHDSSYGSTGSSVFRRGLSYLLAVIGLVLIFISVPLMWFQQNIMDRNGFSNLITHVSVDKNFQDSISHSTTNSILSAIDRQFSIFGGAAKNTAEPYISKQVNDAVSQPGFQEAVRQSMMSTYDDNISIVQNYNPQAPTQNGLNFNPAPLENYLVESGVNGIKQVPGIASMVPSNAAEGINVPNNKFQVGNQQVLEGLHYASLGSRWSSLGVLVGIVAYVVAFLISPRRAGIFRTLGLGLLIISGIWYAAGFAAKTGVGAQLGTEEAGKSLLEQIMNQVTASFNSWAGIVAIIGGTLFVVSFLMRLFTGRR